MYHPSKWGEGYFLRTDTSVPYVLVGDRFIEVSPIIPPSNWSPDILLMSDVSVVYG